MSIEHVIILLILFTIMDASFTFGRYTAKRRIEHLENENQTLRDLLNKNLRMEKLTSQTYSKIAREFASANAQEPTNKPKSRP